MIYWKSWQDFFAMGGYGLYVWGSYAVTLLVLAAEVLLTRQRLARLRSTNGKGAR
jgi:heme exporter protein D